MERQGTLTGLNNPLQIQITQTAASSFIFAFSALTEGLEVDNGEGPHLHYTDLQMQLSKTNISGLSSWRGMLGFCGGKRLANLTLICKILPLTLTHLLACFHTLLSLEDYMQ